MEATGDPTSENQAGTVIFVNPSRTTPNKNRMEPNHNHQPAGGTDCQRAECEPMLGAKSSVKPRKPPPPPSVKNASWHPADGIPVKVGTVAHLETSTGISEKLSLNGGKATTSPVTVSATTPSPTVAIVPPATSQSATKKSAAPSSRQLRQCLCGLSPSWGSRTKLEKCLLVLVMCLSIVAVILLTIFSLGCHNFAQCRNLFSGSEHFYLPEESDSYMLNAGKLHLIYIISCSTTAFVCHIISLSSRPYN